MISCSEIHLIEIPKPTKEQPSYLDHLVTILSLINGIWSANDSTGTSETTYVSSQSKLQSLKLAAVEGDKLNYKVYLETANCVYFDLSDIYTHKCFY